MMNISFPERMFLVDIGVNDRFYLSTLIIINNSIIIKIFDIRFCLNFGLDLNKFSLARSGC